MICFQDCFTFLRERLLVIQIKSRSNSERRTCHSPMEQYSSHIGLLNGIKEKMLEENKSKNHFNNQYTFQFKILFND